jgi:hypothetical protein
MRRKDREITDIKEILEIKEDHEQLIIETLKLLMKRQ